MKTLIVEDDFTSRLLLQEILKAYGETHIAVNGKEAVEAARIALESGENYDLICLDIMMPEMDGLNALTIIRRLETQSGIKPGKAMKVIMTTAISDELNVKQTASRLYDSYLTKPIRKDTLLEILRQFELIS